jgi:hypothetical protein
MYRASRLTKLVTLSPSHLALPLNHTQNAVYVAWCAQVGLTPADGGLLSAHPYHVTRLEPAVGPGSNACTP